jgi:hypothetical protein
MAISPNDTFLAGQVLTAQECNQFPRGIVAFQQSTASDATITAEEIQLTASTFTAVANRYYRITYYEPQVTTPATAGASVTSRIRLTNLAGTQYQLGIMQNAPATAVAFSMKTVWVGTLTAGSTVIVASLQCSSGTATATRSTTAPGQITIEDIGPA